MSYNYNINNNPPLQNSYAKIGLIDEFIRFIPEIATFTKNLFRIRSLKNSTFSKAQIMWIHSQPVKFKRKILI